MRGPTIIFDGPTKKKWRGRWYGPGCDTARYLRQGLGQQHPNFRRFNISKRCAMDDTQLKDDKACVVHLPLFTTDSRPESYRNHLESGITKPKKHLGNAASPRINWTRFPTLSEFTLHCVDKRGAPGGKLERFT